MSRGWEFAKKGAVIGAAVVGVLVAASVAVLGGGIGAIAGGLVVGAIKGAIGWGIVGGIIGAFTKDGKDSGAENNAPCRKGRSAEPSQGVVIEQDQGCTKFRDAVAASQSQAICR